MIPIEMFNDSRHKLHPNQLHESIKSVLKQNNYLVQKLHITIVHVLDAMQ